MSYFQVQLRSMIYALKRKLRVTAALPNPNFWVPIQKEKTKKRNYRSKKF
jgi:hypothetical protein